MPPYPKQLFVCGTRLLRHKFPPKGLSLFQAALPTNISMMQPRDLRTLPPEHGAPAHRSASCAAAALSPVDSPSILRQLFK